MGGDWILLRFIRDFIRINPTEYEPGVGYVWLDCQGFYSCPFCHRLQIMIGDQKLQVLVKQVVDVAVFGINYKLN
jgi:hypothetical protein